MNLRPILSRLKQNVLHFGFRYKCPLFGFHQSSFKPKFVKVDTCERHIIGGGVRPCNCWRCFCSDRERLVYLYCKNELGLFLPKPAGKTIKLLHIAPEKKLSKVFLNNKNIDYIAGDLHMPGYSYPDFVSNMDITDLRDDDNTYDLIICCHVLEHVPEDRKAIKELFRVLKPGGSAILQVPICPDLPQTDEGETSSDEERWQRFGQYDHLRLYGQDYKSRLEEYGFKVNVIEPKPEYSKFGVNPEEKLHVGHKG